MLLLNKIYLGDFKDIVDQIDNESISLVYTDPPYLKEYLYTYDYLADFCPRIMKRGASLMTIVGHYALEKVMDKFRGKLKYRWLCHMSQFDGPRARMAMGVEITFKPLLWYVKESYPSGRGFLRDGVKIEGKAGQKKERHKWEQDTDWCEYYISKLTKEGDIVLDPYAGSGTVPFVCKKLNRQFLGIEKDEESFRVACERIGQQ